MGKSVFALVLGLMLMFSSAAGYAYIRLTMSDEAPPTESSTADPGVAACEALFEQATPPDSFDDLDPAIITGLTESENADLQAAGDVIEALAALPPEQQAAALPQLTTALTQIATGCADLGVASPEESAQPTSSPSP